MSIFLILCSLFLPVLSTLGMKKELSDTRYKNLPLSSIVTIAQGMKEQQLDPAYITNMLHYAADKGSIQACYELSTLGTIDASQAEALLTRAAQANYMPACFALGKKYVDAGNWETGFYWIGRAAYYSTGYPPALYLVERIALGDYGAEAQKIWADGWIVHYNNIHNIYRQASCYYNAQEYSKAFELFKHCALQKYVPAYYMLGLCYEQGLGTEQDTAVATRYFKRAALQEYPPAQYTYAVNTLYYIDYAACQTMLKKALSYGHKQSAQALERLVYPMTTIFSPRTIAVIGGRNHTLEAQAYEAINTIGDLDQAAYCYADLLSLQTSLETSKAKMALQHLKYLAQKGSFAAQILYEMATTDTYKPTVGIHTNALIKCLANYKNYTTESQKRILKSYISIFERAHIFNYLKKLSSNLTDKTVFYWLGIIYNSEIVPDASKRTAYFCFRIAAHAGHVASAWLLAQEYSDSDAVKSLYYYAQVALYVDKNKPQEYELRNQALAVLENKALDNNDIALCWLIVVYLHSDTVQEHERALKLCHDLTIKGIKATNACLYNALVETNLLSRVKDFAFKHKSGLAAFVISELYTAISQYSDTQKIIEFLQLATQWGNLDAQVALGHHLLTGTHIVQDKEQGLELIQQAYQSGNISAYYILGRFYCEGVYVPNNEELGRKLIMKAADEGFVPARALCAFFMLQNQEATLEEKKLALDILEQTADHSEPEVHYLLAKEFYYGKKVPNNYKKALYHAQAAVHLQVYQAYHILGLLYSTGQAGLKQNEVLAEEYYRKAIAANCYNAIWDLAECYTVQRRYNETLPLYQRLSDNGESSADIRLCHMYLRAQGVEKDVYKAAHYFIKACQHGLVQPAPLYFAQPLDTHIFRLCINDIIITTLFEPEKQKIILNLINAYLPLVTLLEQEAQNERTLHFALACCYYKGIGTECNYVKAREHCLLSRYFCPFAASMLGDMYQYGQGVEINDDQALIYYKEALLEGVLTVQYDIAQIYYKKQKYALAYSLYQEACKHGCYKSSVRLASLFATGPQKNNEQAVFYCIEAFNKEFTSINKSLESKQLLQTTVNNLCQELEAQEHNAHSQALLKRLKKALTIYNYNKQLLAKPK